MASNRNPGAQSATGGWTSWPPTGWYPKMELSGSLERLVTHFQEHVDGEQEVLDAYLAFRDQGPEHVRYLVDMILEDERRHHRTFRELVNRLRSDIDWRDNGPMVPYLKGDSAGSKALIEATDRFLAFERDDEKSLKQLHKELRPVRDTTLFSLLVELMALDTKKHIAILEFIRNTATRS
jgi:rubrerythrin